jgi:hypothetical protein
VALPEWVRGRGLALYITVMFGGLSLGSALWGEVASVAGLPVAPPQPWPFWRYL